jgi:imidazolonepropionase
MSAFVVENIGELVTNDPEIGPGVTGILRDAAIVVEDGRIAWVGPHASRPGPADARLDAAGRAVIPGFVDSHAHLVFAGDRGAEFAARMAGAPYGAGGIASTVAATRAAGDTALAATLERLVREARSSGTTTIECKSGYGLTPADEARSLEIASRATTETTFLGAHVVPAEYAADPDRYVDLVCGEMLDACAPLARFVDVFCERGAFDREQSLAVLRAGAAKGLIPRVHANQLGPGPGVEVAALVGAASADHCSHLSAIDIDTLRDSGIVATLLPGAEFSTRSPYPEARRLLDAGVTVALASDCNPGSSYTTNLPFCIALGVVAMGMTTDEALWAATMGGARALCRGDIGQLVVGARADLVLLEAPSHTHIAYRPGVDLIARVWKDGVDAS